MTCQVKLFASVVMNARPVIMDKSGRNFLGKLYVVHFFKNTLCMLHLMLVIWNFIFGHKGEVDWG